MRIGAVVVLYNPDVGQTERSIQSLLSQVDCIYIADNSDTPSFRLKDSKIVYNPLCHNIGIAAAQNIGIRFFVDNGYDFVLFSDQDSTPQDGLVESLAAAYMRLKDVIPISAIGPMPVNRKTGTPYIYKQCIIGKDNICGMDYYMMHSIISSYSLVPVKNFNTVGMMDERLFIDFVDQQWCWRAAYYNGMTCILVPGISITHELGVSKKFLGRGISVSTPFRMYFQTRNLLWLSKETYTPRYWKRMNIRKFFPKIIYYSLFSKTRMAYIRRILKGLTDGLTKRLRYEQT